MQGVCQCTWVETQGTCASVEAFGVPVLCGSLMSQALGQIVGLLTSAAVLVQLNTTSWTQVQLLRHLESQTCEGSSSAKHLASIAAVFFVSDTVDSL